MTGSPNTEAQSNVALDKKSQRLVEPRRGLKKIGRDQARTKPAQQACRAKQLGQAESPPRVLHLAADLPARDEAKATSAPCRCLPRPLLPRTQATPASSVRLPLEACLQPSRAQGQAELPGRAPGQATLARDAYPCRTPRTRRAPCRAVCLLTYPFTRTACQCPCAPADLPCPRLARAGFTPRTLPCPRLARAGCACRTCRLATKHPARPGRPGLLARAGCLSFVHAAHAADLG